MLSEKAIMALFDIRDNIFAAQRFTAGFSFDQFRDSQLHFYAVTRALEIISEASKRLPDEVCARHPELPWQDMRDAGTRIGTAMTMLSSPLFGRPCRNIYRRC